jgi:hypothetical protein
MDIDRKDTNTLYIYITVFKSINPNAARMRKYDGIYFNINVRRIHVRVLGRNKDKIKNIVKT